MPMPRFNPSSTHPARGVQAWQILVIKAMNRQTVTYQELSNLMYRKNAAGVLDQILGHIAFYCEDKNLPALTTLVVGKSRGKPGAEIPVDPENFDVEREKVYRCDWYDIYPPTESDLANAWADHHR